MPKEAFMSLILDIIILIAGFIALIKGADWFVDGSAGMAKLFRVPEVIIGLTIVAMGTSAPELAVSVSAGLQGSNEIAVSNVIGSNIFNLLVVLGVCTLFARVPVDQGILKRDFPLSILASVLLLIFVGISFLFSGNLFSTDMNANVGELSRPEGLILLGAFALYLTVLVLHARKERQNAPEDDKSRLSPIRCLLLILIGLVLIIAGGKAVVYGAKAVARAAGMSETLIGLTVVAIGTSLPELVTSIVASKKGENGLAVGNVVGSNLFNILLILGVSSTLHPIAVNAASVFDLLILIICSIIGFIFAGTHRELSRREGIIMLLIYIASMAFAIVR